MSFWPSLSVRRSLKLVFVLLCGGATLPGCAVPSTPTFISSDVAPRDRTITVGGTAKSELVPDEACIEMTLIARDGAMSKAHARLYESLTPALAELRATSGLIVEEGPIRYNPEYETDGHAGPPRLVRHAATAQVNVRTKDFGRIPEVVGRLAARGLDRVEVVFYATDMAAARADLRKRALEATHTKAKAMAETLGAELGEVITITEGDASMGRSIGTANYLDRGGVDAAPDAPAPPGAIPLFTTVGVVYRVK